MTSGLVDRHPLKEKRRANKPLLERKRRARINDSLTDLKHLVLSSLNKDVSKYNKMEKVDILDMTVRFLKGRCLEQEDCSSMYRAGYQECTKTMYQNIMTMDGLDHSVKCRILSNLANSQREDSTKMSPPPSPTNQYPVSPNTTNLNSRLFAPPPPQQFHRQQLPPLVRKTPANAPVAPLRCLPPVLERGTSPKDFDRRSPPKSPLWRPW